MSWYRLPSGMPFHAVDGTTLADRLLSEGATIFDDGDVAEAITAWSNRTPGPGGHVADFVRSAQLSTAITEAVTRIVDGAPAALDTLKEIGDQLAGDESAAAALATAVALKLDASKRGAANGVASLGADGKQLEAEQPDRLSAASLNAAFVGKSAAPSAGAVNIIGSPSSQVGAGSDAVTVLGGTTAFPHVLDPGSSLTVIPGGYDNKNGTYPGAGSPAIMSVILGAHHLNDASGGHGSIGGGSYHGMHGDYGTISGGTQNTDAGPAGSIGGGRNNRIGIVVTTLSVAAAAGDTTITTTAALSAGQKVFIGLGRNTQARTVSSVAGLVATLDAALTVAVANAGLVVASDGVNADAATIAGGSSNLVNKTYGTVGGGFNNKAQGTGASILGGTNNAASGNYSGVAGGDQNNATGAANYAHIGGGQLNTASGQFATVPGGYSNTASGPYSTAIGQQALASRYGEVAQGSGGFAVAGDSQASVVTVRGDITGAVTQELCLDGNLLTQRITLPDNTGLRFKAEIFAWSRTDHAVGGVWTITGGIGRGTGAASTALFGTPTKTADAANVAGLDCAVSADTANGALKFTGTSVVSKRYYFSARVTLVQVAA